MKKRKKIRRRLFFAALLLAIVVSVGVLLNNFSLLNTKTAYPREYREQITRNAEAYHLEEALLYAVVRTESGFQPDAVSSADAKGLTQITPDTFRWLQTKTGEEYEDDALFDPEVSVKYGAFFLRYLLDEFGNTETALAAYHAGRGIVNEWLSDKQYSSDGKTLKNIPYDDTKGYVRKVMKAYEQYGKLYD